MSSVLQDLRYALRSLGRAPGFTLVVVFTLGLGIGANTAIFSLLDQVVLRALDVRAPAELVQLDGPGVFSGRTTNDRAFSYPMYRDFRDRNTVFAGLMARFEASVAVRIDDDSERVRAEVVSGNTFELLGARPALGRLLTEDDDRTPGGHPVVVLSDAYWRLRFGAGGDVVGRSIVVNATPMTVVGVAPPGFAGVVSTAAAEPPSLFVTMAMKAQMTPTWDDLENRRSRWLHIVGRLAPGQTLASIKAPLDGLYRQINEYELEAVPAFAQGSQAFRDRFRAKTLTLYPAGRGISDVRSDITTPLAMLMAMVGVVLLIACANVANLMLARATGRQREMGVRLAIGASRGRLVRLALVEGAVLAVAGAAVGLLLSFWLGELLLGVLPVQEGAPTVATSPDRRVLGFTLAVSAISALLFGLTPALHSSKPDLNRTLKDEAAAAGGSVQHARLRKGLVVAQIALSTLLIAGAGLFTRSLTNLLALDPGFDTEAVTTFAVDPSLVGYSQIRSKQLHQTMVEALGGMPGVRRAALASEAVLTGGVASRTVQVQGYEPQQGENLNPWTNEVTPGYFETLGIPLVAGRDFTARDADGAPRVAIVNQTFARYFFGAENPIGRRFGFRALDDPSQYEIIGVARDSHYSQVRPGEAAEVASSPGVTRVMPTEAPRVIYTALAQSDEIAQVTVYVKSTGVAAGSVPAMAREAVARLDAGMPTFGMTTLEATAARSLFVERMLAVLSGLFGLLATGLAAVGLYGVMAYMVARRTREIGIRIALGAERGQVLGLVLREVAILLAIGIALGLPGAVGMGAAAKSQLFGLSPVDPVSLDLAAALLASVGLLAGYLPARRAAATQPLVALRTQ